MSKGLRYFMLTAIMAIGLVLGTNQASAQDVYMGNDEDGYEVYIQTETIKEVMRMNEKLIQVKSKHVLDGVQRNNDTWEFFYDDRQHIWFYQTLRTRKTFHVPINLERNALAKAIFIYCLNYL